MTAAQRGTRPGCSFTSSTAEEPSTCRHARSAAGWTAPATVRNGSAAEGLPLTRTTWVARRWRKATVPARVVSSTRAAKAAKVAYSRRVRRRLERSGVPRFEAGTGRPYHWLRLAMLSI
jgi:hypothetical protein